MLFIAPSLDIQLAVRALLAALLAHYKNSPILSSLCYASFPYKR